MVRITCHRPLISKKNQKVRLDFTTLHILWTEEQWNMVHFGSNVKRFVRHKTVKVWVGERNGVGNDFFSGSIVRFHGNINTSVYKELSGQHALHLHKETVETPIFVQDKAPCNKAKTVLSFLEEEGIAVKKRPPESPDVNLIGNVWKFMGEKARNRNPRNIDGLWGFLKEEWENISATFCKKLIGSCGRRCNEVIQCKGKLTKYWIFLWFDLTRIYDALLNF